MIEPSRRPVKAVGLDFDDFLVASRKIKTQQHIAVAADFGIQLTRAQVDSVWGSGLRHEMATYYGHPDPRQVSDDEHRRHLAAYNSRSHEFPKRLLPGAAAAYRRIINTGLPVFMLTSLLRENAIEEMAGVKLDPTPLFLVDGSDTAPAIKPDRAAFGNALEHLRQLHIAPRHVLYGGDALNDARGSQAAGLQFLGVPSGQVSGRAFSEAGFNWTSNISHFASYVVAHAG